ncbi:MAG TPA: inositol monophosphatase family protein [Bryobacterales bacterium]|jgi:myo-inositol-1(or 4)-monophosphatase|nr:inositol monophosphatase family protein [Bryobacterales bacterium]
MSSSYLSAASEIAREAGALLARYFERRVAVEYKGEFDVVTEADRASESLIVSRLRTRFPHHSIVAEEGSGIERSSEFTWYVDPLDGTTNFAHGFPMFAVTMGLEQAGELVAAVTYDPLRDEFFSAEKGGGAYLNSRRLQVSRVSRLSESLLATGFPSRKRHGDVNIYFYHQAAMLTHGVRRAGSAALDLAYVAAGRLDGFWEFRLNAWDIAAGLLLVREAGGCYSDMHGAEHRFDSPELLASNGLIHRELLSLFGDIFANRIRVPLPALAGAVPPS